LSYLPETGRHFGGVGMMVNQPGFVIEVRKSVHDDVAVVANQPALSEADEQQIVAKISATLEASRCAWGTCRESGCQVTVCRVIPAHSGFGSGTQLRLAVARAWRLTQGLGDCSLVELARVCERGRRSAIGLWCFEWGGLLVDAGQRQVGSPGDIAARADFPQEWRVLLITQAAGDAIHGCHEESRMSKLAPMRPERTGELCRLALTEILPAIRGRNLQGFREGLQSYGDLVGDYFAPVQGGRFSHPQSAAVADDLRASGVTGVVQSSWGPTLCAFFEDADAAAAAAATLAGRYREMTFTVAAARNYGADVELR
jgi:beta-RFAP synthase